MAMDGSAAIWQAIRQHLQDKKAELYDAIGNYPPPIPACDQQFNYLLEQRAQVSRDLARLETIARQGPAHGDTLHLIDEFLRSSTVIDDALVQQIRAEVGASLSEL